MRRDNLIKTVICAAVLCGALQANALAAALTLGPESHLWLEGDSTLHPYASTATALSMTSEVDLTPNSGTVDHWDAVLNKSALKQLKLTIPVKSLKSKESALDKNLYKAMKAGDFPEIVFNLSSYEVQPSTTPDRPQIITLGTLTIAGKTQPIRLTIDVLSEEAALRLKGHYTLQMTQYGITPPSLMFGTIKVRDRIDIYFDLRVEAVKS